MLQRVATSHRGVASTQIAGTNGTLRNAERA
jgi:hypothetical protein